LLDIARGLDYLHTFDPPVIHGDLKGVSIHTLLYTTRTTVLMDVQTNILITASRRACVADFGLCTLSQDLSFQFTPTSGRFKAGTFWYCAPELLHKQCEQMDETGKTRDNQDEGRLGHKTLETDVYAFGCVCYEVCSIQYY
jgi:serine/threonine protein kinase